MISIVKNEHPFKWLNLVKKSLKYKINLLKSVA